MATQDGRTDTATARRELLRRKLAEQGLDETPVATPSERNGTLTAGQRRMWSLQQLYPQSAGYNVRIAVDLTGTLDPEAMATAARKVVSRHDVLRTTYRMTDDVTAVVQEGLPPTIALHDVSVLPEEKRAAEIERLCRELGTTPFDLATDSPVRVGVITASANTATLVVAAHHIVWDDATTAIFFGELMTFYADPSAGLPPAKQFGDLVLDVAHESGIEFWREYLGTPPEPLDLPVPRDATVGLDQHRTLRAGVGDRLREMAKAEGASTFIVLLAAVTAVLHLRHGARDVVIAAPVTNRDFVGGDEVVGYLGNTLPLRLTVEDGDTFARLVARAKAACLAAYAHQDVDLDDIARAVDPDRAGLFDVVLSQRTPVLEPFRKAGFEAVRRQVPGTDARFPLTLAVEADGDDLVVEANHPVDVHSAGLISRLLAHLDLLLDNALAAPGTPIRDLPPLSAADRAELDAWNDTAADIPAPLLPELFARQVAATPDARAVLAAGEELTYRELDRRAAALARMLVAEGVGPESIVALAVPRSVGMLVAALAVLKSGAAYVPVDPEYPADRVRFMLTDSRPSLLLTTSTTLLPVTPGLPTILVDTADLSGEGDPGVTVLPEQPAYVIYTSGSTGVPKGVVITHDTLRNHLKWSLDRFAGLTGHTLVHSSISFDFTVTPLFGPLIVGGCVELCADSPDAIADALGEATFLKITPSHLPLLPSVRFAATGPRTLLIAGEELRGEALDGWQLPEGMDLINEYGPTETTVGVLLHPVDTVDGLVAPGPVPVGSPVDNVTCHVLDDRLREVPVGVEGELYLGGRQDARGYLNRPGLTAIRFVANPFGEGRLYRTGDRVRRLPGGELEFRGRVDEQVKIRGHRVEPGEVEAVLRRHPSVSRAAVVARTDGPGGVYLAAYVVAEEFDVAALRSHVADVLPEHMVPAAFVRVNELPLSPSGKLDRKSLPAPVFGAAPRATESTDKVERVIAELFADVLKRDSVGVDESFFELGGDSIVAIRLVGRAAKAGLKIKPRDVFAQRTPAKLAALVGVGESADRAPQLADLFAEVLKRDSVGVDESFFELGGDSIVAIRLVGRAAKAGLKLTPRQVFAHRTPAELAKVVVVKEAAAVTGDGVGPVELTPIMRSFAERGPLADGHLMSLVVDAPEVLDEARLRRALQAVVDCHDALRARLTRSEPRLEFLPVSSVRADTVLRRGESDVDTELVAAGERLAPAEGVVLQAVWFEGSAKLLLVAHHLVVDGVSWRVLVEDLAAAYRGETLAPMPTPFRRWATGLRASSRADELATWRSVVSGPDPLWNKALSGQTWSDVRTVTVRLDSKTTEAVLTSVPALFFAGVDDVLLTALAVAGGSFQADARSFTVLLEGHGRQEAAVPGADLSRTVGWFTSQHPVRLDTTGVDLVDALDGGAAAGVVLKRIKEHLRTLPDNGIGFGVLRHLNGEQDLATPPRIGFNYLGRFDAAGEGGWTVPAGGLSAAYGPDMPLFAGLVVNAVTEHTADGPVLVSHWMYADGVFEQSEVERLASLWHHALRGLTRHASGGDAGGRTPSDVSLISLNQGQLDALESKWKRA